MTKACLDILFHNRKYSRSSSYSINVLTLAVFFYIITNNYWSTFFLGVMQVSQVKEDDITRPEHKYSLDV